MNMKKWTLLVAMIGVLLVTAFANDGNDIFDRRTDFFNERRAFFKEHIKPKVDAQRNKLEESISPEDKKDIDRLRGEIINQLLIENEFLFESRASRIKGDEFDEDLMMELRAQRIVIENLYDETKIISNKYRPEIDDLVSDLREDLRDYRENLRSQQDGTRQGYGKGRQGFGRGDGHGPRGNGYGQGIRGGFGYGKGIHRGFGPGSHRGFNPDSLRDLGIVTFLLWDVNRG